MITRRSTVAMSLLLGVIFPLAPTQAHHSQAMFDGSRTITLTGKVREFQWTNPHCYIQLDVPASNKGVRTGEWSVELGAPTHLLRSGWKATTLKPGDQITVVIKPLRDGHTGGKYQTGLRANGTPIASIQ